LGIYPENISLLNNLGYSYYLNGQYEPAVQPLRTALSLYPNYRQAHNNLGLVYGMMGRYEESLKEFKKGGEEAPAYNNIGYIYYLQGKYPEAIRYFNKALELRPSLYVTAHKNLKRAEEKQSQDRVNE